MALSNYTELQASIASYLNRNDLTSAIPDFIALCEADLNVRLRSNVNETMNTAFSLTGRYTTLPTDFAEMRRVFINSSPRRELMPLTTAGVFYTEGEPKFYNIINGTIEVVPISTAATLELSYWKKIPALATNSTNVVLTNHPNLYLFGSCVQAGYYLDDGPMVAKFEPKYESALALVNGRRFQAYGTGLQVRAG